MVIGISTFHADEVKVNVRANKIFSLVFLPFPLWFHPYVHPSFIIISATVGKSILYVERAIKDNGQKLSY